MTELREARRVDDPDMTRADDRDDADL